MLLWLFGTCAVIMGLWPTVLLLSVFLPELRAMLCMFAMALTALAMSVAWLACLFGLLVVASSAGEIVDDISLLLYPWIGSSVLLSLMLWIFHRMYKRAEMLALCEEKGICETEFKEQFRIEKLANKQKARDRRRVEKALRASQRDPWSDPPL